MLLGDASTLPGPSIRTLRLSSESFLGAVIYEDSTPLYSVSTEDAQTSIFRHGKTGAPAPLTLVSTIAWSELESPESSPVDSPTSFTSRFVKSWTGRDTKDERAVTIEVDGRTLKQNELLKSSTIGG